MIKFKQYRIAERKQSEDMHINKMNALCHFAKCNLKPLFYRLPHNLDIKHVHTYDPTYIYIYYIICSRERLFYDQPTVSANKCSKIVQYRFENLLLPSFTYVRTYVHVYVHIGSGRSRHLNTFESRLIRLEHKVYLLRARCRFAEDLKGSLFFQSEREKNSEGYISVCLSFDDKF